MKAFRYSSGFALVTTIVMTADSFKMSRNAALSIYLINPVM